MSYKKNKIKSIIYIAVLLAFFLIFSYVPYLGFIPTPWGVQITTLNLIVGIIIFASSKIFKLNPIIIGIFWGLLYGMSSLIMAYTIMPTPIFQNPGTSILPRTIWGLVIGFIVKIFFHKDSKNNLYTMIKLFILSISLSFFNTLFVISAIYLFFPSSKIILSVILLSNFLPELILTILIFCPLGMFMTKFFKKHTISK